ncbi:MAG: M14-type cytosolic carboxypeptidase, partial [Bryobacteraceae bacterium]
MTAFLRCCLLMAAGCAMAPAAVSVHAGFESGSIGRVEHIAPFHIRCAVKGEVDQDKRNRQASWYYFAVKGAAGREITVDLIDLPGEYNYRPGNLAINGATRPFISYDRRTWTALPDAAVDWDNTVPRLRLRFTPSRSPVWIAHVPPYTTRHLARLLQDVRGRPGVTVAEVG